MYLLNCIDRYIQMICDIVFVHRILKLYINQCKCIFVFRIRICLVEFKLHCIIISRFFLVLDSGNCVCLLERTVCEFALNDIDFMVIIIGNIIICCIGDKLNIAINQCSSFIVFNCRNYQTCKIIPSIWGNTLFSRIR